MYLYSVGSSDEEGGNYHEFESAIKYTKKQLQGIVAEVLIEILSKECHVTEMIGSLFYNKSFIKLMKKRGFKPVKYQARVSMYGFMDPFRKKERDKWANGLLSKMVKGKIWKLIWDEKKFPDEFKYKVIADNEAQARNKFLPAVQDALWRQDPRPIEDKVGVDFTKEAKEILKTLEVRNIE